MRSDPVLIGALGGSGTRVVARIARAGGVFMGSRLNAAEDSEPLMDFYDAWLRRYLERGGELDGAELTAAEEKFGACLEEHLVGLDSPAAAWGVKVPRSILMLRFWHRRFPGFRFVHVVRSGLDMAYSSDRNQLRMVGDLVLSKEEQRHGDRLQAMAYWRSVNLAAAEFGERQLGRRYLRIRFEDLCAEPVRVCTELGRFLEIADTARLGREGATEITPPPTLGRWRGYPAEEVDDLVLAGGTALERLGYGTP